MKFKSTLSTEDCVSFLIKEFPSENKKWKRLSKNADDSSCSRVFFNGSKTVTVVENTNGLSLAVNTTVSTVTAPLSAAASSGKSVKVAKVKKDLFTPLTNKKDHLDAINDAFKSSLTWVADGINHEENFIASFYCQDKIRSNRCVILESANGTSLYELSYLENGFTRIAPDTSLEFNKEFMRLKKEGANKNLDLSDIKYDKIKEKAKLYYFQYEKNYDGQPAYLIVKKKFFDKHGYLDDQERGAFLNKLGFEDCMESVMEFWGDSDYGREILLTLGMEEKHLFDDPMSV